MKRRDFLKVLGIAPAIAVVPILAKTDTVSIQLADAKPLRSYPKGTANWDDVVEAGRIMDAADISNNALEMIGSKGNNFDATYTQKMAKMFLEGFDKAKAKK